MASHLAPNPTIGRVSFDWRPYKEEKRQHSTRTWRRATLPITLRRFLVQGVVMKRLFVAGCLVAFSVLGVSGTAHAQSTACGGPCATDFADPVTGEIDLNAYLAAVAAANNELARTGTNSTDLVPTGVALIVIGGTAVGLARWRKDSFGRVNS
jgi:hypothetical protein